MPSEAFNTSSPQIQLVPQVHPTAFVHASAQLLGEVRLGPQASVWPTTVLRGDCGAITVGARTNVQDGSVAHATTGRTQTVIGDDCTIGHRVVLHGCRIGHRCLIGIGSIVMDDVEVGDDCFVAAGSLLTPGKKFPPRSMIMGSPARVMREISPVELEVIDRSARRYLELAASYSSRASSR